MLKVVIRKSDKKVMPEGAPWRQDSPNHRPGIMEAAIAKNCGGTAEDYEGFLIPDKDKVQYTGAKRLRWDAHGKRVIPVPYTPVEEEDMRLEEENERVEAEMIQLQVDLDAAEKLGLDRRDDKMKLDKLKAQHEAIKDKKKDK